MSLSSPPPPSPLSSWAAAVTCFMVCLVRFFSLSWTARRAAVPPSRGAAVFSQASPLFYPHASRAASDACSTDVSGCAKDKWRRVGSGGTFPCYFLFFYCETSLSAALPTFECSLRPSEVRSSPYFLAVNAVGLTTGSGIAATALLRGAFPHDSLVLLSLPLGLARQWVSGLHAPGPAPRQLRQGAFGASHGLILWWFPLGGGSCSVLRQGRGDWAPAPVHRCVLLVAWTFPPPSKRAGTSSAKGERILQFNTETKTV